MAKILNCPFFEIPAANQTHAQIMFTEIVREAREARAQYAGQVSKCSAPAWSIADNTSAILRRHQRRQLRLVADLCSELRAHVTYRFHCCSDCKSKFTPHRRHLRPGSVHYCCIICAANRMLVVLLILIPLSFIEIMIGYPHRYRRVQNAIYVHLLSPHSPQCPQTFSTRHSRAPHSYSPWCVCSDGVPCLDRLSDVCVRGGPANDVCSPVYADCSPMPVNGDPPLCDPANCEPPLDLPGLDPPLPGGKLPPAKGG